MTRKITLTCELPEELCEVLERQAVAQGHPLEELVAQHLARRCRPVRPMDAKEATSRRRAFERHFGQWDIGQTKSSDNDQIDADLAREYGKDHRRGT